MNVVIEKNKGRVEFVEPQSMNFDKKVHDVYSEFLLKQAAKV